MAINLQKINLQKEHIIDLKKKSGIGTKSQAQVVLVLDYSYSMTMLYKDGTVQKTVERLLPFGIAFDDNGEVDTYIFQDTFNKIPKNVTIDNLEKYVSENIVGKYSMGGTKYAPVLEAIYDEFKPKKKGGFLGFGAKSEPMDYPVYVIFITDGDNFDKYESEEVIKDMSSSGFFVQFIGVGNENFNFLEHLDNMKGRRVDNVNFFKVKDLNSFSDDQLYEGLMSEYPEWYKKVKDLKFIK